MKNNIDNYEKKERKIINLYYNQGKTTHEIAKIERMSIHDISAIFLIYNITRQDFKAVNINLIRYAIYVRFRSSAFA